MICEHFEIAKFNGDYAIVRIDNQIDFGVCHKCYTHIHHFKGIVTVEFHNKGVLYKTKKQVEKILALVPF
jgi:hypothetical protein